MSGCCKHIYFRRNGLVRHTFTLQDNDVFSLGQSITTRVCMGSVYHSSLFSCKLLLHIIYGFSLHELREMREGIFSWLDGRAEIFHLCQGRNSLLGASVYYHIWKLRVLLQCTFFLFFYYLNPRGIFQVLAYLGVLSFFFLELGKFSFLVL